MAKTILIERVIFGWNCFLKKLWCFCHDDGRNDDDDDDDAYGGIDGDGDDGDDDVKERAGWGGGCWGFKSTGGSG